MRIPCIDSATCVQVLDVLQRHSVTRSVSWEGGSPLDTRMWIIVLAVLDPAIESAIRRDIDSIAGAAIEG